MLYCFDTVLYGFSAFTNYNILIWQYGKAGIRNPESIDFFKLIFIHFLLSYLP